MELLEFKDKVLSLRGKLEGFARNMLSNEADAEDAVQETYLRLWSVRDRLDNHPNIGGFAMQTLKNICYDKLRKHETGIPLDHVSYADQSRTPDLYTEQHDSVKIIRMIVDTLPELQRRTLVMRDIEGYELSQIAEIMGADETAVRVNLSRARKKVRDKYVSMNKMVGYE